MSDMVGRDQEARLLISNCENRRSSLLMADSGMGKTTLLNYIYPVLAEIGKPVYTSRVGPGFQTFLKEVFAGLWEHALIPEQSRSMEEDVKAWAKRYPSNDDKSKFLCNVIAGHPNVIVVIDDANGVTTGSRPWLESMAESATMIACIEPRSLEKKGTKRFWKRFDEVSLGPLSRTEAKEALDKLVDRYKIVADDMEIYRRKVLDAAQGSPYELERLVKYHSSENLVKTGEISGHTQQFVDRDVKQIALAPLLLIFGIILVASRYVARARADMDLYVVAGIALVVMIVLGPFIRNALKPRSK